MALIEMPSGNMFNPFLAEGVMMFAGKGVVIRNAYNKTIVYEPEPDSEYQKAIAKAIYGVLKSGRNWKQPDWAVVYAEADKKREAEKARSAVPDVKGRPAA